MRRSSEQVEWSSLRRYVGLRINLFRAMYTPGFYLSDGCDIVALRQGLFALVVRATFDPAFSYFYVQDCHWYRADLEEVVDDEVPEVIRQDLLGRFLRVLS